MTRATLYAFLLSILFGCGRGSDVKSVASSEAPAPPTEDMAEKKAGATDFEESPASARSSSGGAKRREMERTAPVQPVSQTDASTSATPKPRMVIKTAELALEVEKFDTASAQAQRLAERYGGFVASTSSNESRYKNVKEGSVVVRVPAEKFDAAMSDLRRLGKKIDSENVKGQDITKEFYDLEARLDNQKRLEARFQEILKSAKTVQEILNVERELSQVRGAIEQLEGQKRFYIDRAGLSTITVKFHEPYPEFASNDERPSFFGMLGKAFSEGAYNFGKNLAGAIEFLIAGIPIFALMIFFGYALIWFFKRFVKSSPKKSVESPTPQS